MLSIIKRILKPPIHFLRKRIIEIRAFRYARHCLPAGLFYIPKAEQVFRKIDKRFCLQNAFHIYLNLRSGQYHTPSVTEIAFGVGSGKVVCPVGEQAIGFFFSKKGYLTAKKNYTEFSSLFNYPCVKVLSFNDDKRAIIMERARGTQHCDIEHDSIIVRDLLGYLLDADTCIKSNGQTYFLQHGDVCRSNVIWDGECYRYIDLDNINYFPPLLDVFHYFCTANYELSAIISVLNENRTTVDAICKRANIDSSNKLDALFFGYVNHYKKMNICLQDYKFLTVENTTDYPKTNELLRSIAL